MAASDVYHAEMMLSAGGARGEQVEARAVVGERRACIGRRRGADRQPVGRPRRRVEARDAILVARRRPRMSRRRPIELWTAWASEVDRPQLRLMFAMPVSPAPWSPVTQLMPAMTPEADPVARPETHVRKPPHPLRRERPARTEASRALVGDDDPRSLRLAVPERGNGARGRPRRDVRRGRARARARARAAGERHPA